MAGRIDMVGQSRAERARTGALGWVVAVAAGGFVPLGLVSLVVCVTGCESKSDRLESLYSLAAGATGRGAAGQGIQQAWYKEEILLQDVLDLAHQRLEKPGDHQSAVFALALLDTIAVVEEDIDRAKVNEFFWTRVGTLAGNGAGVAFGETPKDVALAEKLMLGGTERWQTDSYWLAHPDHDALVAIIMHERGQSAAAMERLRSRPDFDEHRHAAMKHIEDEVRKKRGG